MRKAIALLGLLSIALCSGLLACSDGNTLDPFDFNGTDPIIKEVRIGAVVVNANSTHNVPLAITDNISFVLNGEMDPITFEQFLDIRIVLSNETTGQSAVITTNTMLQDGEFVIHQDGHEVEYQMNHTMEKLWIGGTPQDFASPGDTISVNVVRLVGRDKRGDWFAFQGDTFEVVYLATT